MQWRLLLLPGGGKEKFLFSRSRLDSAQMGTSGDNGALSLATSALTTDLGATVADIQLANMVCSHGRRFRSPAA
ncbi:MAG: hypothetical protein ACLT98_07755 [Eggerthellaceae bacterium]